MRLPTALAMAALLAACSFSEMLPESKKIDYKSASKQTLPPLEIPPDLTAPSRDNRYAVPDIATPGGTTYSAYAAERSGATRTSSSEILPKEQAGRMRIERSGTERWLVVPQSPEKVWPQVKEFWQESGFLVRIDQPEVGVMETDWAEDRAKIPNEGIRTVLGKLFDTAYSTGERDKFRTRLERGSEPGTTEIYISHRGMIEVYISPNRDQTAWQPRLPDPDLEAEFLRRLMVRFGMDNQVARAQLTSGKTEERAKLVNSAEGIGSLEIAEPFDRAWRRVGLALDRVGFTVEDRDRSKGFYFVRYVDPEIDVNTKKSDSWFSKLAFWRSDSDPSKSPQYRVLVKDTKDTSQVQVLNKDGEAEKSDTARKILSLLHDQLK